MAESSKKVLFRLEGAKMHFPVKKESVLQKEKLAVRAVDGVSINIYQGETLGLVGESGCGKSTLGRLVLQLYKPTDGKVYYYGITLDDYAPAYVKRMINRIPSIHETNAQTLLEKHEDMAVLVGGLLLSDDLSAVKDLLLKRFAAVARLQKTREAVELAKFRALALSNSNDAKAERKLTTLESTFTRNQEQVRALDGMLEALREKVAEKHKDAYALLEEKRTVGINIAMLTSEETRRLRRYIQIVFQDPYSSLNPRLTVGNLVSEALVAHNVFDSRSTALEAYTMKILEACGLQRYMVHRYPHQFSGGQRQRIGIARALALNPSFVVCDEAVSALDVSIQSQVINLLIDLKEQNNLTYLFISHDLSTVKFISDRVGVMYLGNIIELGESHDIYQQPLHPYTEALLEAIPTTEENSNKELQVLEGDIPSPIRPPSGCKFHTRCRYATDVCKEEYPQWRELLPDHFVACHHPVGGVGETQQTE